MWVVLDGSEYCHVAADADGNEGMCVTDGTDAHGNNEDCVIAATQALYATATYFDTEENYDDLTIGGTAYSGTSGPGNLAMAAGDTMVWDADSSVALGGWIICASTSAVDLSPPPPPIESPPPAPSPPPPTLSPAPPAPASYLWTILDGVGVCEITADAAGNEGACVTDGSGQYSNSESCVFRAQQPMYVTATTFSTEEGYDYIYIGSNSYHGTTSPQGVSMAEGSTMRWASDSSASSYDGFTVCGDSAVEAVTVSMVCSGDVASFNTDSFKSSLATSIGVETQAISLTVHLALSTSRSQSSPRRERRAPSRPRLVTAPPSPMLSSPRMPLSCRLIRR
jgi:hypothetical protein